MFFLIRIKDGRNGIKMGLELPRRNEFDLDVSLKLTRKQTNDVKKLLKDKNHYRYIASSATFDFLPSHSRKSEQQRFYEINFRIVRFEITPGNYETVLTSLDVNKYPPKELKRLYALRWGIETSFRDLKYTVGMLNFHSKTVIDLTLNHCYSAYFYFGTRFSKRIINLEVCVKHSQRQNFASKIISYLTIYYIITIVYSIAWG